MAWSSAAAVDPNQMGVRALMHQKQENRLNAARIAAIRKASAADAPDAVQLPAYLRPKAPEAPSADGEIKVVDEKAKLQRMMAKYI